jgi:T5SS/PEP-CTERM-associated repeat protein
LTVTGGGTVNCYDGVLGDFGSGDGNGTVSGAGSKWDLSGGLTLGRHGHGELTISAGGTVSCQGARIGLVKESSGAMTVESPNSVFVSNSFLNVGSGSNRPGQLTVRDGARVDVAGTLRIQLHGTMSLEGGQVTCGSFDHSAGGTFDFTGGELHVETFIGDLVNDGGTICSGQSPGLMTVYGNLVLNAGTVEIELAGDGSNPAWCDRLDITGDVTLGGVLELDWLPVAGDPTSKFGGFYDILTYRGGLSGGFTGFGGNIGEAYIMGIVYDADLGDGLLAVRVELADLLAADTDLDGQVGYTDYAAARDGFGSTGPDWFSGDLDFDGEVSYLDYVILKRSFGDAVAGAGSQVPEPTTLALLALGGLAAIRKRRRT